MRSKFTIVDSLESVFSFPRLPELIQRLTPELAKGLSSLTQVMAQGYTPIDLL
jgi:hypothetical protein